MKKIAVSLSKGGVGKSTTALNLAAGLAVEGKNVLLVDTDTQGQLSKMLGVNPSVGLAEFLEEDVHVEEAIVEARKNLWFLSGGKSMAGVKRAMDRREIGGERGLTEAFKKIKQKYDFVILDTSPGWDVMTINVLFYAQEILAPVSMEVTAVQGLIDFRQNIKPIKKYNRKLSIKYILPTFLDRRIRLSEEIMNQLRSHYRQQLCDPIRYSVKLKEAPAHGMTIYEYAPKSPGAEDYQKLTERISNG